MELKHKSSEKLAAHPLFASSPELWASAAATFHTKNFKGNEQIVLHGDSAVNIWLVFSGWIKLTRQTPDGKETVVGLCTERDILGEAAIFPNASYPYTAEVVGGDAQLLAIPSATIRSLISKEPSLSVHIMSLLNERTTQSQLKFEHMSTMSAAQRLGCFFLRLCHMQTSGAKQLKIPVEKHVLAAYLGMKPETLSRSQQQLKPIGVSALGHTITIERVEKLLAFVCNSCSESGNCDIEDAAG